MFIDKRAPFNAPSDEGKAFVAERLAAGVAELRDMIVDAWRSSADVSIGYPAVWVRDIEDGKVDSRELIKGLD